MTFSPKVWGDALRHLQNDIPDFAFEAWIAPLQVKFEGNRIVLGCPSSFHCDRVRMHHAETIRQTLQDLTGRRPELDIVTQADFAAANSHTLGTFGGPRHGEDTPVDVSEQVAQDSSLLSLPNQEEVLRTELRQPRRVSPLESLETQALAGSGTGGASSHRAGRAQPSASTRFASSSVSDESPPISPKGESATDADERHASSARLDASKARRIAGKRPSSALEGVKRSGDVAGSSHHHRASLAPHPAQITQSREGTPATAAMTHPPTRRVQQDDLALSLDGTPAQGELPFSFESFIVGPCNSLAREAALALARQRQRSLNQIYLGAEAGMGKTHLARATAIEARRHANLNPTRGPGGEGGPNRPGIVYTTAEQFTSEFVSAMRRGRSEEFKKRYRGPIGLLIVEDVQSFQGRAKTQLELFNTIEHVLDAGGRVMLTGDRSPRDLGALDPRMREQLGRGFVAELEAPDALVRRHLLRAKAASGGVHLPEDCLDLLVESTEGSVRDIESVLIQVVATSSLLGRAIDLDLTLEAVALKSGAGSSLAPKTIAVSEIVRIVSAFFGKRPEALASRSRRRDVLIPRQLAMYLAHRYTDASFTEIGKGLGRDHPAVRNAIQRVERLVLENAPLRYQVEALSERIDQTLKNQAVDSSR